MLVLAAGIVPCLSLGVQQSGQPPAVTTQSLVRELAERYERLSPLTLEIGRAVRSLDPRTGQPRTRASAEDPRAFRISLQRLDDRMAVRISWDVEGAPYVSDDAKWVWVDDRFRMFSPREGVSFPVGQIRGEPLQVKTLDSPGQHAYFQIAGLFANETDATRQSGGATNATSPWWQWFSETASDVGLKVTEVDAAEGSIPGELARQGRLVRCELGVRGEHPSVDTVWLDPARGYMPVRMRKEWFAGSPDGNSYSQAPFHTKTHRVMEAKEVRPDLWVPTRTIQVSEAPRNPDPLVQEEFIVTRLSMDALSPETFEVDFPPGTEVIDWINQVCYRILEDGRVVPRPFLPAANAPVTESPQAIVKLSLEQNPPYDGFVFRGFATQSELATASPGRPASIGSLVWPALLGLGIVVLVFVIIQARYPRRRLPPGEGG
jgi:hypothetical protein